jgi:hypothetical protein
VKKPIHFAPVGIYRPVCLDEPVPGTEVTSHYDLTTCVACREWIDEHKANSAAAHTAENPHREWRDWRAAVDVEVDRLVGLSSHDLPDCPYRDWFEDDDMTPQEAARRAVREAGY